jgi:prostaglandin reductase 1
MIRRFSSSSLKAKVFMYVKDFRGEPTTVNFELMEEHLPALKNNEILASAEYLSVDPYMRPYMLKYKPPCLMIGGQMARVVDSKNPDFPVDSIIFGQLGWRTHTVFNPTDMQGRSFHSCYIYPTFDGLSRSLGLGYLGMPGNGAHFGLNDICRPKAGETFVVTSAAGALGSLAGQLAKIKGCNVIGLTGSDEKCRFIENELGFDRAINYKSKNLHKQLKQYVPNGIDVYFDSIGGEFSSLIFNHMNEFGRVAACGAISSYNSEIPRVPAIQTVFVVKQLRMEGFIVYRYSDRWMEGIYETAKLIKEGKIKCYETVTEGFENMPNAFIEMLQGKNYGKSVVKV